MIAIDGLTKHYGSGEARTRVLDDVTLTIDAGEFVSIIGTSGSGKTTLLNIIGGLDSKFEGKVSLNGREVAGLSDAQLAHLRNETIGFVFQQFNLLDHLSALENVALPSFFGPGDAAQAKRRATELLERVGLGDRLDAPPTQLSGGQKQRVAIARALFAQPAVILCDEPTGSLDRKTGVTILDLFADLNRDEGITLIMVTHEEHIARMSRRIIRLEDGVVVTDIENTPIDPTEHIIAPHDGVPA